MRVQNFSGDTVYDLIMKVSSDSTIDSRADRNRRALIRGYEAQLTGDFDTWWNLFDPNVHFRESPGLPYAIDVTGLEEAKRGVAGMLAAWSQFEFTLREFCAAGNVVIIDGHMKGTSRKTGLVYDADVAEYFRFSESSNKVIDWTAFYWDTSQVRAICGFDK